MATTGFHLNKTACRDYISLMKPRVVALHLITAAAAMFLAAGGMPPLDVLIATLAGGGLTAGASNVINCYFDRDIDKVMFRTHNRPLPAGRLSSNSALFFGICIGLSGLLILILLVSWPVSLLALGALAYYILVYTLWLKRRTYWSSIIGSGAGAFPPLIGWVAVTGRVELTPFLLFAIIVFWTPPHFWSLAIFRKQDYESVGLGVIPSKKTGLWIVISSFALVTISLTLVNVASLGLFYTLTALFLNAILLSKSTRLHLKEAKEPALELYIFSIFYLVILFGAVLLDKIVFY